MKDDLIALLEALRLVRAEIDRPIRLANPSDTLDRIEEIVADPDVDAALRRLDPDGHATDAPEAIPTSRPGAAPSGSQSMRPH
jgi:hypothetical protein